MTPGILTPDHGESIIGEWHDGCVTQLETDQMSQTPCFDGFGRGLQIGFEQLQPGDGAPVRTGQPHRGSSQTAADIQHPGGLGRTGQVRETIRRRFTPRRQVTLAKQLLNDGCANLVIVRADGVVEWVGVHGHPNCPPL